LEKEKKYRKRTSYLPTVLSITIVLFLTGLLGLVFYQARQLDEYFRENFEIRVYLHEGTDEKDGVELSLTLKNKVEVKSAQFVSKDEAAEIEIQEQGIDFIENLGYNPLPHTVFLKLNSEFTSEEKVSKFVENLKTNKLVESVGYPENILTMVNQNLKTLEWVLLAIVVAFLLASLLIINSTIRLNIFARRFLIKSMQYVGAKDGFIIRPFLKMYFWQGIVGALLAIALNAGILLWVNKNFPGLINFNNPLPYLILAGILILMAIVIILPSTYFACRKYLRLDINKLY